jgi:hypothetical protein
VLLNFPNNGEKIAMKYIPGQNYNPALLKLELLSKGIRVENIFADQLGKTLKEPLWTRTGPTSTGIDLILEKGIYASPAIEGPQWPYSYKNSPFTLTIDDQQPVVAKNGEIIQKVKICRRPLYYSKVTSDGVPMSKIGAVTGDFLAVAIDNRCWFWGFYREEELVNPREKQCKFCGIGIHMYRGDEIFRKSTKQILEVLGAALEANDVKHIAINAGTFPPPERGHREYAKLVADIKAHFDVWIRLSLGPPEEEKFVDLLFEAGADQIGYNYEVYDAELFAKICPGKFEEVDKGKAHEQFGKILRYAAKIGGPNRTFSILVTGLESRESTVAGVEHLCQMGVVPRLEIFRPIPGTPLEKHPAPSPEFLVYVYRKLREITMKYGVDSGCSGCGRTFVASKEYDGLNPAMPEITDEDLERAGIDRAAIIS